MTSVATTQEGKPARLSDRGQVLNVDPRQDYDYLFKVILAGDSGVGKTSLITRFADDYFSESAIPTIGVDFVLKSLSIDNKVFKLQVWDTAGQDRFRQVVSIYFRSAHCVMLTYDMTRRESFDSLDDWMRLIHLYAPEDVVIFLVGNKSDLEHKRVVSREEAERYASSIGADYGEASARTGDEVDECMFRFTVRVMEKQAKSLSSQKSGGAGRRRDASTLSGSQLAGEKSPVRRCNCF